MQVKLQESKNIKHFGPLFESEGLIEDFDYGLWDSILTWCNIKENTISKERYWKVFLIRYEGKVVGLCGFYSIPEVRNREEVWLSTFFILPEYRNKGIGKAVILALSKEAKLFGFKYIYSYVSKNNRKALRFYKRQGFERICDVAQYRRRYKLRKYEFEDMQDHIIKKFL